MNTAFTGARLSLLVASLLVALARRQFLSDTSLGFTGLDQAHCRDLGMQQLAVRRCVEKGGRFIQIQHGDGGGGGTWDAHGDLKKNHEKNAPAVDQRIGALLTDLDRRGLLDETLVVFATKFGRTLGSEGTGTDHHPFGFSVWMAGVGVKHGHVHGTTDEIVFHAVENRHFVTDVHDAILKQLGLDSRRLEIPGRKRLAVDHGTVIDDILA